MATKTVATRKRRAWTTTVFVKQLMAIEAYDHYAHWLKEEAFVPIFPHGGFIWVFRAAMVLMLVIHIWAAAVTWKRSRRARRSAYVVKRSAADAYAARTMRMTGVLLFFLIVFHILHFTTGTIRTGFVADSTPYERMVATFQNPLMVVVYLIFIGLAALHVSHGFWSAFQSLGWVRGGTRKFMEVLSGLVGALIFLMFALPPLAIVAGYIS